MEALERSLPAEPGSLALLARQAGSGDRRAYGRLVEDHWSSLVRLARSVVGETEAEDVVQDALIHAWTKLGGLRRPESFSAWISRVVVRACLRRKRSWRRRLTFQLSEDLPTDPVHPSGDPTAASGAEPSDPTAEIDLQRSLAVLAPRQRAVLHLTVVEEMTDSEIAERMGITAASVRSHRRRARERLAKLWKET